MKASNLIVLIGLLLATKGVAQTGFYKQFSGNGYDYAKGIVELPDSSYIITGASSSFTEGPSQMFLLKLDSLGAYQWSKHFGGEETDWGIRVKNTTNNELFVGGYTNSSGNGAFDFALWKLDQLGNEQWMRTYGTTAWERVNDMALTSDNGVIMVGETTNTLDGHSDVYMVRTDSVGTVIWEKQLTNPLADNATVIQAMNDSVFVVAGYKTSETLGNQQFWVLKMHEDGTILFEQTWGTTNQFKINDIEIHGNQLFTVGSVINAANEEFDYISKLHLADGAVLYNNASNSSETKNVGLTTFQRNDLLGVVGLRGGQFSFGLDDLFYYLFDENPYWNSTVGAVQYQTNQLFGEVITSYSYGMISVGTNEHIGPGGSSIFVKRIGAYQTGAGSNDIMDTEPLVSIQEVSEMNNWSVYPNPVSAVLTINTPNTGEVEVLILNVQGQEMKAQTIQDSNAYIDVSELPIGMYFVQLMSGNRVMKTEKIVKN